MSDEKQGSGIRDQGSESSGLNLWLAYGLIALGLLLAAGCAALIVFPFYGRH